MCFRTLLSGALMVEWVHWWFDSRNYMPHGHCYLWQPAVLWLNVGSDLAIGAAYMAIPTVIGRFARRRAHEIRFGWVALLFASFIFLCGMTHFFEVWTAWYPSYRIAGLVKAATAIVSVSTAATLVFVMPQILTLRTPGQLETVVAERTRDLEQANCRLQEEIVARRTSEAALEESQRLLQDSDRRKDEFLATLAHELRNPLAPIRNGLALLDTLEHHDPTFERSREIMKRQVAQMVRLIDDLLDVSRISTGRITLQSNPLILQDAIIRALETAAPSLAQAHHTVTTDLPDEPIHVMGDEARLTQVFTNLLTNSAKYMQPGGRVHVQATREDGRSAPQVRIDVIDHGMGIATENLARVFDMFVHLPHDDIPQSGGLGIGLAISRRFVELHGGTIEVHSDGVGRGAQFTVTLPLPGGDLAAVTT
jgi:signal transduction histidine kinase